MRRLILFVTVGLTAACVRTAVDPVTGRMDVDVESPAKRGEEWKAELTGQNAYSGVSASAVARVIAGTTTTTLNVRGGMPGARHPWHIHSGTCATGGPIVGEPASYPPIVIGSEGTATQSAQVQVQLNEAQRYHVNIHLSPTEMGTIVACGDLDD